MERYLFVLLLLILFFFISKNIDNFRSKTNYRITDMDERMALQKKKNHPFLNQDEIIPYLTEYKCIDYEDLKI